MAKKIRLISLLRLRDEKPEPELERANSEREESPIATEIEMEEVKLSPFQRAMQGSNMFIATEALRKRSLLN